MVAKNRPSRAAGIGAQIGPVGSAGSQGAAKAACRAVRVVGAISHVGPGIQATQHPGQILHAKAVEARRFATGAAIVGTRLEAATVDTLATRAFADTAAPIALATRGAIALRYAGRWKPRSGVSPPGRLGLGDCAHRHRPGAQTEQRSHHLPPVASGRHRPRQGIESPIVHDPPSIAVPERKPRPARTFGAIIDRESGPRNLPEPRTNPAPEPHRQVKRAVVSASRIGYAPAHQKRG